MREQAMLQALLVILLRKLPTLEGSIRLIDVSLRKVDDAIEGEGVERAKNLSKVPT